MARICLIILLFTSLSGIARHLVLVKDLSQQLKYFSNGSFVDKDETSTKQKTVYLAINANDYRSHFLEIEHAGKYELFINGGYVTEIQAGKHMFNLDSLAKIYSSSLAFAFHRELQVDISARIVAHVSTANPDTDFFKRSHDYYLDFSILVVGILLLFFLLMYKSNPKLLMDYFNFIKLFSLQEREENLFSTKIMASGNLLIYGVVSLFVAFMLMTMNFYAGVESGLISIRADQNVLQLLWSWIKLSVFLFLVLMAKSILIFSLSRLFDFSEALSIQFFNFVRLTFLIGLVLGLLLSIYFILGASDSGGYVRLFYVMSTLLVIWMPLVFLKLMRRSPYTIFHLFSYLCASEIFPVVIAIKLLFYKS